MLLAYETMTAADVLDQHWDGNLPVRPDLIAHRQGIVVLQAPMVNSGLIRRVDEGKIEIVVNSNESAIRNRFTIAHELGHFNLGHLSERQTLFRDDPNTYSTGNSDPREREANAFAASLLMPADAIKYVLGHGHAKTVFDLKAMFGVSEAAMRFRLKNLGYL